MLLAWRGSYERAWELSAAFAFCLFAASMTSVFFPAAGPFDQVHFAAQLRALLPDGAGTYHLPMLHELRSAGHYEMNAFRMQGVLAFHPSTRPWL
jgi:hypothetical protein